MKIYFSCSISGGRHNEHLYPPIVAHLKHHGEVLTEMFSDDKIVSLDAQVADTEIFNRDMLWLEESDAVVAEVSTPSFGVGFEVCKSQELGKDVLCLYQNNQEKKLSAMISGNPYKKLMVRKYTSLEDAFNHIDEFFARLKGQRPVTIE